MTAYSAHEQLDRLGNPDGYCVPLALDSTFKHAVLPEKWYEAYKEANANGEYTNDITARLLKDFYGVEAVPSVDDTPIAYFTKFGGSSQCYFPDVAYHYPEVEKMKEWGVTHHQFRLRQLLSEAAVRGCSVLFQEFHAGYGMHAKGLDLLELPYQFTSPEWRNSVAARYAIRENGILTSGRLYDCPKLAGIQQDETDSQVPLPEVLEDFFPERQTSWELTILPPEPK